MAYEVVWSPKSVDGLNDLEKSVRRRIVRKVEELKPSPHHFAERLSAIAAWKLRVGDYRVILDIDDGKKEIHVLKVGHRKKVYK